MMQEYWITEYGAVADGVTNCAAAIQAAVDAAAQAGGGRVMVPAGRFLSGSVMLRSHVELHLCSGAVLQSSLRPEDIRPFRHADADDAMDGWNGGFFLGACGGQDITINDDRGANNDGIDPDCCQDVIISGCLIHTGDDAIVVKATGPMTRRYGPCCNVTITNCVLHSRDSALKIGTETCGDIRNITFGDCLVKDCSRAVGIWVRDGGTVENIQVHHLVGAVRRYADRYSVPGAPGWWGKGEALFVNATRRAGQDNFPGVIRNVSFDHITMKAESCLFFAGESYAPLYNIRAEAVDLTLCRQGTQPGGLFDEQPSARHLYPHEIPALYARCVQGLRVRDCRVRSGGPGDWSGRPALLEDCPGAVVELDAE